MFDIDINQAYTILKPLLIFAIGMAIYSVFIFKFYKFIARKDVFELNLKRYNSSSHPFIRKTLKMIFYIIEYILLFPVFAFFWFAILTALLSFLSKNSTIQQILLVSVAVVAVVRICAYYSEDLSKDLAKMLPFALLGIFLVDISFFTISSSLDVLKEIPSHINLLIYYLGFIIALEFILRIGYSIKILIFGEAEEAEDN
jgi:hypothetical protein